MPISKLGPVFISWLFLAMYSCTSLDEGFFDCYQEVSVINDIVLCNKLEYDEVEMNWDFSKVLSVFYKGQLIREITFPYRPHFHSSSNDTIYIMMNDHPFRDLEKIGQYKHDRSNDRFSATFSYMGKVKIVTTLEKRFVDFGNRKRYSPTSVYISNGKVVFYDGQTLLDSLELINVSIEANPRYGRKYFVFEDYKNDISKVFFLSERQFRQTRKLVEESILSN